MTGRHEKPMRDAYDAEVLICPGHEWVIEDRTPASLLTDGPLDDDRHDWYMCIVCDHCRAARCGHLDDPNPCVLPRHHLHLHEYADGSREWVGGYDQLARQRGQAQ